MSDGNSSFFVGLGILVLATSILGCATAKMKKACFAIPFGILTFIFGLILLIIGFMGMAIGTPAVKDVLMKAGCNNDPSNPMIKFDNQFNEMVVKPMCSGLCPCPQDALDTFQNNIETA